LVEYYNRQIKESLEYRFKDLLDTDDVLNGLDFYQYTSQEVLKEIEICRIQDISDCLLELAFNAELVRPMKGYLWEGKPSVIQFREEK